MKYNETSILEKREYFSITYDYNTRRDRIMEEIAKGWEAVKLAENDPEIQLNKHTDPIDNYMEDIKIDFAEEVCQIDPGLIFATKRGEEINWD